MGGIKKQVIIYKQNENQMLKKGPLVRKKSKS